MHEAARVFVTSLAPFFKAALMYTMPITIASFVIGLCIATAVSVLRLTAPRWVSLVLRLYVVVIRDTPLMVQLFVIFYGLPWVGIVIDPIPSAIIGFSLNVGAYASETMRASLEAVPRVLLDSGISVGFTKWQNFWYVLLPHAAYSMTPPLFNSFIDLVKSTSLASLILVPEILRKAQEVAVRTNNFILVYCEAALVYLVFCLLLEKLQRRIERCVRIEPG